jgi:hypothetical protein
MEILVYVVAYTVSIAISAAILAGSLFLVEDRQASSFKELGVAPTLARCAGIVLVTTLLGFIPFGFWLALVAWFVGIMFLFQKTFLQTLVVWLVNVLIACGLAGAVSHILTRVLHN